MTQLLTILESDDATPATAEAFGSLAAGTLSTPLELHVWFGKGVGSGTLSDVALGIEIFDTGSSTWIVSGHIAIDEKWFRAWVGGSSNPGLDPAFFDESTDPVWLGVGSELEFSDFVGNSMRKVFWQFAPPLRVGAATEAVTARLVARVGGVSYPLQAGVSDLGCGVLTLINQDAAKSWVDAPTVLETGTPDDKVNVSRRWWVWNGVGKRDLKRAVTLNQNDGATVALVATEEYTVLLTQGASGTPTVTKGLKAGAGLSTSPAAPAGELILARVVVSYHATASVITNAAITVYAESGRMVPTAGTGLTLQVGQGKAIVKGGLVRFSSARTVALPDNATRYVWLSSDGTFLLTTTEVPPVAGVLELASVTTVAGAVTAVVDKRRLLEPGRFILELQFDGNEALATNVAHVTCSMAGQIDRIEAAVATASSGATGATILALKKRHAGTSTTIFTGGGGSPESRPSIAAQAFEDPTAYPEVTTFARGDRFELDFAVLTSGGSRSADGSVAIICYPL